MYIASQWAVLFGKVLNLQTLSLSINTQCWFIQCVCTLLFPAIALYLPMHTISSLTQLEIWSTLGAILHRSLSNIHMCRQLHLIHHCLDYLRKTTSDKVASKCSVNQFEVHIQCMTLFLLPGHVTRVIEILGSYSLSLKELRDILSYLYTGQMKSWVSQCAHVSVYQELTNLLIDTMSAATVI